MCLCVSVCVCVLPQLKSVMELSEFRKNELKKVLDANATLTTAVERVRDEAVGCVFDVCVRV